MINQIFNCDCLPFMQKCKDNEFDLAIVDPPYGIGECASRNNTGNRSTLKWKNPESKKYKMVWDIKPNKNYFIELFRISKNQIIWGANNFIEYISNSTGWIIWDKQVSENEHLSMAELAYSNFNVRCKIFRYLWAGFKKKGNNKKKERRIHPTQKPVALYKWLLKNYAKPGQKIFDSHIGSGSIRIACYDMGFDLTGCEVDKDYFEAQEKRFQDHIFQQELFEKSELQKIIFDKVDK